MILPNNEIEIGYLEYQLEVFHGAEPEVRVTTVTKGRRVGLTQGAAQSAIEFLLDGMSGLWVDVTQGNLNRYYDKFFKPVLKRLPSNVKWRYHRTDKILTVNGVELHFRSAERPENIEGFGYHFIMINEAGIVLSGYKGRHLYYESVLPMSIDYDAYIYLFGVPKGLSADKKEKEEFGAEYCLYKELCDKGDDPDEPRYRHLNYSSYANPLNTKEVIEELERVVPSIIVDQEIYGKFIKIKRQKVFKETWFEIIEKVPQYYEFEQIIISADTAFKTSEENDDTAMLLMAKCKEYILIMDMICDKFEFAELITSIKSFYKKNNLKYHKINISEVLIEDKASGQSAIQMLMKNKVFGGLVKAIKVDKDKYSRAIATTDEWENGRVKLLKGHWNKQFVDQHLEFSILLDTSDDIVDAGTQGINYLTDKEIVSFTSLL
jgi:predicted phage terminase large subunit-like protein